MKSQGPVRSRTCPGSTLLQQVPIRTLSQMEQNVVYRLPVARSGVVGPTHSVRPTQTQDHCPFLIIRVPFSTFSWPYSQKYFFLSAIFMYLFYYLLFQCFQCLIWRLSFFHWLCPSPQQRYLSLLLHYYRNITILLLLYHYWNLVEKKISSIQLYDSIPAVRYLPLPFKKGFQMFKVP